MPKLVLDPGHGGRDPGAIGFGLKEADVVLDLSTRIAAELHALDVEVLLTRDADVFVAVEERARRSKSSSSSSRTGARTHCCATHASLVTSGRVSPARWGLPAGPRLRTAQSRAVRRTADDAGAAWSRGLTRR
jgi:N-acetylmuramoyl-L-alanine amidase